MAFAMGFKSDGVTIDIDNTGETKYVNDPVTGLRRTLTRFVGYLGPSGFGLCAAKLIETGQVLTVLWLANGIAGQIADVRVAVLARIRQVADHSGRRPDRVRMTWTAASSAICLLARN